MNLAKAMSAIAVHQDEGGKSITINAGWGTEYQLEVKNVNIFSRSHGCEPSVIGPTGEDAKPSPPAILVSVEVAITEAEAEKA